jgi:hypothetical protein
MNDQDFARGERFRLYWDERREQRSDAQKREAARHGPRSIELAHLEERAKLAEIRMYTIAQFSTDACRTMTAAESLAFDEAQLELGQLQRQIRSIIG